MWCLGDLAALNALEGVRKTNAVHVSPFLTNVGMAARGSVRIDRNPAASHLPSRYLTGPAEELATAAWTEGALLVYGGYWPSHVTGRLSGRSD